MCVVGRGEPELVGMRRPVRRPARRQGVTGEKDGAPAVIFHEWAGRWWLIIIGIPRLLFRQTLPSPWTRKTEVGHVFFLLGEEFLRRQFQERRGRSGIG